MKKEKKDKKDYDYLFKLVLIGDTGVGKSCVLLRFADDIFTDSYISTIGVDFRFRTLRIDNKIVKLQIWDTAGQERYKTITSAYYRGADGIILCYDVTNDDSFKHVSTWIEEVNRYAAEDTFKLLIGNKCDRKDKIVSTESAQFYANEIGVKLIEVSAKEALNIQETFETLASELIRLKEKKINDPIENKIDMSSVSTNLGKSKDLINNEDINLQFINIPSTEKIHDDKTVSHLYIIALCIFKGRPINRQSPYIKWEGKAFVRVGSTVKILEDIQTKVNEEDLYEIEEAAFRGSEYLDRYLTNINNDLYKSCFEAKSLLHKVMDLPIQKYRDDIVSAVVSNRLIIVTGGTGCGKSTMVPYYLWKEKQLFNGTPRILISQPRRMTSVKLAEYFAKLNATPLGYHVGYRIGGRKLVSSSTLVTFCTNGSLYEMMKNKAPGDVFPYDIIVLDEAHEGDIYGTVSLPLLLDELQNDTTKKLIIMSATLLFNQSLKQYLDKYRVVINQVGDYPIINIDKRQFKLRELYIDDPTFHKIVSSYGKELLSLRIAVNEVRLPEEMWLTISHIIFNIGKTILHDICSLDLHKTSKKKRYKRVHSSVLVFLPGMGSLHDVQSALLQLENELSPNRRMLDIVLLHSSLSYDDLQKSIDKPLNRKRRRVYLSTNMCESSLTLTDVRLVIDTCTQRLGIYNSKEQRTILHEQWYGKINGIQRTGRVGRMCPGTVIRMLPRDQWQRLPESIRPEIQRADLSELILNLLDGSSLRDPYILLGKCQFAPSPTSITAALKSLVHGECLIPSNISATTSSSHSNFDTIGNTAYDGICYSLTPLGRILMKIPGSIATGRILMAGINLGLGLEACVFAALMLKPFPIIRTHHRPLETFRALRTFALGCRSDCIAGFNAYCYWLRNRREQVRIRCEVEEIPTNSNWYYHERTWLREMFISPFSIVELDELVMTFRKTLANLGYLEQPTREDIERSRGLGTFSETIETEFDDGEDDEDGEDEELIQSEFIVEEAKAVDVSFENNEDIWKTIDLVSLMWSNSSIDSSMFKTSLTTADVKLKAKGIWDQKKNLRHVSPLDQYRWYQLIISQWESPNAKSDHSEWKYLHYFNSDGCMDMRCFGMYLVHAYGLPSEMLQLYPSSSVANTLIVGGFTTERHSLHFEERDLHSLKAKISLKTSSNDIKTYFNDIVNPQEDIIAIQSKYFVELNCLSDYHKIQQFYSFPPIQPPTGLSIQMEQLSLLPMKSSINQYPIGWPVRPRLCPSILLEFSRNSLRKSNPTERVYINDLSVCQPLSCKAETRDGVKSNFTLRNGLLIAGKLIPMASMNVRYDLATIFPDDLHGAFNIFSIFVSPRVPSKYSENDIIFEVGFDSNMRSIHAAMSNDILELLRVQREFHACLEFIFDHPRHISTSGDDSATFSDSQRHLSWMNSLRTKENIANAEDLLRDCYKLFWNQKIAWK